MYKISPNDLEFIRNMKEGGYTIDPPSDIKGLSGIRIIKDVELYEKFENVTFMESEGKEAMNYVMAVFEVEKKAGSTNFIIVDHSKFVPVAELEKALNSIFDGCTDYLQSPQRTLLERIQEQVENDFTCEDFGFDAIPESFDEERQIDTLWGAKVNDCFYYIRRITEERYTEYVVESEIGNTGEYRPLDDPYLGVAEGFHTKEDAEEYFEEYAERHCLVPDSVTSKEQSAEKDSEPDMDR